MRLNKFLSQCGVASRRKADELIEKGKINVNGRTVKELGYVIDEKKDEVFYEGRRVKREVKRYIAFNKPKLVITSLADTEQGKPTIKKLLGGIEENVYPTGRLDYDAEGLLILTNDGELANRVHHPSFNVKKLYFAVLSGKIPGDFETKIIQGVNLEDGFVKPDSVKIQKKSKNICNLNISFHEGKKHLVKRYFKSFDLKVIKLKRLAVGNILLGDLEKGKWRELEEYEIEGLKKLTSLSDDG